ncbi:MAG: peptidoglycan DD-metalloendopeptidase family protein [Candidatus Komeilibacteria bacterium]|nr:peptidoglycan DD-metalloendopeptidase family protein [Candidatus Komeilibacteria bacterium]
MGDTPSYIAKKFGITINTLLWENNLTATSLIRPGQSLKILPVSGVSYKITKGDTLKKVAARYNINENQIAEANNLSSRAALTVGQIIFIPGGAKPKIIQPKAPTRATIKNAFATKPDSYQAAQDNGTYLLWPTVARRITQYFGWRHAGLDIGSPIGQPIYAAEDGVVEKSGWNSGGYGNYVIINHGGGLTTIYGHASALYVVAGETVSRGQIIAAIGSTGRSTGPHLHFEVRINGKRGNPLSYIR